MFRGGVKAASSECSEGLAVGSVGDGAIGSGALGLLDEFEFGGGEIVQTELTVDLRELEVNVGRRGVELASAFEGHAGVGEFTEFGENEAMLVARIRMGVGVCGGGAEDGLGFGVAIETTESEAAGVVAFSVVGAAVRVKDSEAGGELFFGDVGLGESEAGVFVGGVKTEGDGVAGGGFGKAAEESERAAEGRVKGGNVGLERATAFENRNRVGGAAGFGEGVSQSEIVAELTRLKGEGLFEKGDGGGELFAQDEHAGEVAEGGRVAGGLREDGAELTLRRGEIVAGDGGFAEADFALPTLGVRRQSAAFALGECRAGKGEKQPEHQNTNLAPNCNCRGWLAVAVTRPNNCALERFALGDA